jgi:hypothetical protein
MTTHQNQNTILELGNVVETGERKDAEGILDDNQEDQEQKTRTRNTVLN